MSGHTPGPWYAVRTPQSSVGKGWKEIRAGQRRVVSAGTFTRTRAGEEQTFAGVAMRDADVALMAAAPAMKDALLAFLPERNHTIDCGSMADNEDTCSAECAGARRALRDAGALP